MNARGREKERENERENELILRKDIWQVVQDEQDRNADERERARETVCPFASGKSNSPNKRKEKNVKERRERVKKKRGKEKTIEIERT